MHTATKLAAIQKNLRRPPMTDKIQLHVGYVGRTHSDRKVAATKNRFSGKVLFEDGGDGFERMENGGVSEFDDIPDTVTSTITEDTETP